MASYDFVQAQNKQQNEEQLLLTVRYENKVRAVARQLVHSFVTKVGHSLSVELCTLIAQCSYAYRTVFIHASHTPPVKALKASLPFQARVRLVP